jgi:hypothetical protein
MLHLIRFLQAKGAGLIAGNRVRWMLLAGVDFDIIGDDLDAYLEALVADVRIGSLAAEQPLHVCLALGAEGAASQLPRFISRSFARHGGPSRDIQDTVETERCASS